MKLFSYWRSTAAYRVRIALNLKGVDYEIAPIDLVKDGGQQHSKDYLQINSAELVPSLVLPDGEILTQSLAIIDYLDSVSSPTRLLPECSTVRAKALELAHTVAMDIHPVNNLRVVQYLSKNFDANDKNKREWMLHWMRVGFRTVEARLSGNNLFSFGLTPNIADICITAQVYNANRWGLDMSEFPRIAALEKACLKLPAFINAFPDNQPDATLIQKENK